MWYLLIQLKQFTDQRNSYKSKQWKVIFLYMSVLNTFQTKQNEPKRAKTSQNNPKQAKATQNKQKRPKASQNKPERDPK